MTRVLTKAIGRLGTSARAAARWRATAQGLAGLVAFGLGFWGWMLKDPPHDASGWANDFFRTLQLVTLQFPTEFDGALPWQLQVGRLAVPIVAVAASFDVVLGAITRPVRLALLPLMHDHVIFLGLPKLTNAALARLVSHGHRLVFVHPAIEGSRLDVLEGLGATVVVADPFLSSVRDDLALTAARAVIVATGSDVDNANLAIPIVEATTARTRTGPPPLLAVEFEDDDLADELVATVDASARNHGVHFHRLSLDREGLALELTRLAPTLADPSRAERLHAIVLGLCGGWQQVLSRLIVALQMRPEATPILTVVLDADEAQRFEIWRRSRPELALVVDLGLLPRGDDLLGDEAARAAWSLGTPAPQLVVVLRDDAAGLATALAVRRRAEALRSEAAVVLVRQSREDRILSLLSTGEAGAGGDGGLVAFGGLLREENVERLLDPAAEALPIALHARYLAASGALGGTSPQALAAWEALPEDLRNANRAAAEHLPILLAAIGRSVRGWTATSFAALRDDEREVLARIEHRRWCADRIDRGWRHGPTRDDARRRHPCLVPWEALSEADRQKDRNSVETLLSLWARIGGG